MTRKERDVLKGLVPTAAQTFHPYYVAAAWTWHVKDGQSVTPYVPTVDDLAASMVGLIAQSTGKATQTSTGGLTVWADGDGAVGIRFDHDVVANIDAVPR